MDNDEEFGLLFPSGLIIVGDKFTETNIIYLIPSAKQTSDNVYDEWIYVDNKWELIGTTKVDLSNYLQLTGGTMTGTINTQNLIPTTTETYSLGSEDNYFYNSYTRGVKHFLVYL